MKLFFKKLGMLIIYLFVAFVGIFGYSMTLRVLNLPYLLGLPAEIEYLFALVFASLFVAIVVVTVRTNRCYEEDLFFEGEKSLFMRIVTSREYIAEQAVMTVVGFVWVLAVGISGKYPVPILILGALLGTLCIGSVSAVINLVLWMVSRWCANRKLQKS